MKITITERQMKSEAKVFLLNFRAADMPDLKTASKMRSYKTLYQQGKLGPKSWAFIYSFLGYEAVTVYRKDKPSDKLIDILI